MLYELTLYFIIFLYGIVIGSFLNVCIYRIPKQENIVTARSHCMNCGYQLKWYDLIPILSYIYLKGRCRKCKDKISIQYPMIELLNGILYITVFYFNGFKLASILYCILVSALLVLSIIDFRTFEIPAGINLFIGIVGIIRVITDIHNIMSYLIGFCSVSGFLLVLYFLTKGKGIGGGDIKLMAVAGLFLGYKLIILAFLLGCILGSILHLIRMRIWKQESILAFGPYLSLGIFISMLFGNSILQWYLSHFL